MPEKFQNETSPNFRSDLITQEGLNGLPDHILLLRQLDFNESRSDILSYINDQLKRLIENWKFPRLIFPQRHNSIQAVEHF